MMKNIPTTFPPLGFGGVDTVRRMAHGLRYPTTVLLEKWRRKMYPHGLQHTQGRQSVQGSACGGREETQLTHRSRC